MKCRICQFSSSFFGEAKVLNRYSTRYFRCENCGFIQTESTDFLEEAYSDAITKSDIGLIGRNIQMAAKTKKLLVTCFNPKDKFIDYGGGYGIFVRLMRDRGFNFYRYDPLCKNMFAEGFEADQGQNYSLLTAWEVFEHLRDPLAEFEKMLAFSKNIFFSTVLLPTPPRALNDWWYYGLEHGQHISFYSLETLRVIARLFNLKLHHSDGLIHLIGEPALNSFLIRLTFDNRLKFLQRIVAKTSPPSLLENDYHVVTGKYIN